MAAWKISADTGGTFTDFFAIAPDGGARTVKVLSSGRLRIAIAEQIDPRTFRLALPDGWDTPDGFFAGFQAEISGETDIVESWEAASQRITLQKPAAAPDASAIDLFTGEEAPVLGARLLTGTGFGRPFPPIEFRLGTTRGTNALLERKGAPVALFITRGFGDLPVIRDQRRADLFALNHRRPVPLHARVIEVDERLASDGTVLKPLSHDFENAARAALAAGIRVAAVSLLHSYVNPAPERALRDRLLALGFEHVSLSSELAPFIKLLPRTETAIVDGTLTPVLSAFVENIGRGMGIPSSFLIMTSAGGLKPATTFRPKDSLLSGPAGGVVGAATAARALGFSKIITFDMGGTSTDVARVDGDFHYRFEQRVGDARLLAPALRIATVASGGGSICRWTPAGLRVGPESAGADPGPACYGRGGPLTITDVNFLLGRIDPAQFGIPIGPENLAAARSALSALKTKLSEPATDRELLEGLAAIATEQMADVIRTISLREGADPAEYALVAFGGAGPLHACDIAERLGMRTILVPREAGLLSAYGIHHAAVERFAEKQILAPLDEVFGSLGTELTSLAAEAMSRLPQTSGEIRRRLAEMRLSGQDATLTVEIGSDPAHLGEAFRTEYEKIFGYPPDPTRPAEVVALRVIAATRSVPALRSYPVSSPIIPCSISDQTLFHQRDRLATGAVLAGPCVIQDPFSTLFLKAGWSATVNENGALVLSGSTTPQAAAVEVSDSPILRELFRHRFENLVEEMGAMLQRSAVSTNVKEREDYSCALLDAAGELVVNAPHIPVHLGALGLCVREVGKVIDWRPGDTIITNHPAFGGSHLPDVTLITPVFTPDGTRLGFVANRAHHAEIGGKAPGSMPPDARSLAEEGVVISPRRLIRDGANPFEEIERLLTVDAPFPTRRPGDNLADLHAQLAANLRGATLLEGLAETHGAGVIRAHLETLARQSRDSLREHLDRSGFSVASGIETLDDGTEIHALIERGTDGRLTIDFSGTSIRHPGNLNATPAIVRSAILYTLRLWTQSPVPLNEGLLREVDVVLPSCFLNPAFSPDPTDCPAVVGGNVETSQRIVNLLIRLLGFQAGSQGTMNNLIFGNERFGYYETIGGGAGAGPDYAGASGLHTHMTNTAITDPEILERRYPVRLREFSLRRGSGGAGEWQGGDGLVREFEFLEPLRVSLLTQHRRTGPFGQNGGENGAPGRQTRILANGETEILPSQAAFDAKLGDVLRIETPGGGGWGDPINTPGQNAGR
jgi:5-oxoprolinase (ATP-hydrolysing)